MPNAGGGFLNSIRCFLNDKSCFLTIIRHFLTAKRCFLNGKSRNRGASRYILY